MKKILFFIFMSSSCFAQTLDPSFGYNNSGIIDHMSSNTPSKQMVFDAKIQSDGKTVCIGRFSTLYSSPNTNYIARYNTDGSFDRTFNQKGWKSGSGVYIQAMYLQNDGKIITVQGRTISRILTNGDMDTSFNTNGVNTISIGANGMNIKAITVQQDNKIVVAGYILNGTANDFAIARLNTDGTLDTSFDTDGILALPIGTGADEAFSVKMQFDNKIIVAGQSFGTTNYDYALARLNPNGTLDTTFGTTGKVVTAVGTGNDYGRSAELLADGKIILLGSANGKFAMTKYNVNGTLNASFGTSANGILISSENVSLSTTAASTSLHNMPRIKEMSDTKLLISGTTNNDFKVIKYLANGSATDTGFANTGVMTFDMLTDVATYLITKPDNSIILGGYSTDASLNYYPTIYNVSANGAFTTGGSMKTLYSGYDVANDIKLLADGKYLILVDTPTPSIRKYMTDGSIDPTFGNGSIITLPSDDYSYKMSIQNDSKILVSGNSTIKRFNVDGSTDTSFSTDGIVDLYNETGTLVNFIDDMYALPNGKILVAFDYDDQSNAIFDVSYGILRMNSDGSIDTSFGTNGYFTTRFNPDNSLFYEFPREIIVQSNGKIVFAGVSYDKTISPTSLNMCSLRLSSDGVLDTTYGMNGKTYFQTNSTSFPNASAVLADDSYLISAKVGSETATYKFTQNGYLDSTFGNNGVALDLTGTTNIKGLAVQPDGKIIKAGTKNAQASISRYNVNGSVDTSFGTNGEISQTMYDNSNINKIIIQPGGKLVALGTTYLMSDNYGDINSNFLARYTDVYLGTLTFEKGNGNMLIYPNPIERDATFDYTLENNEKVSVEIIDLQGRVIKKVITDEEQNAGKHSIQFSLNESISSGNYFMTITSQKGKQSVQILKK